MVSTPAQFAAAQGSFHCWLRLFVELRDGERLDATLREELSTLLRSRLSPRHVPDAIVALPSIPTTVTGKKLEVPVKRYLQGDSLEQVADAGALLRPQAMRDMAAAVVPFLDSPAG